MRPAINGLGAVLLVCAMTLPAPGAPGSPMPSIVERAAAWNRADLGGVIVHQRHITVAVSAGPAHYSEQNDAAVMMQDGQYTVVRYLRVVKEGKTLGQADLAQRDSDNARDLQRGAAFFKQPYDARYLRDYSYTVPGECQCASGEMLVAFQSLTRDDQHGDGTMRIDSTTGRVLSVTYIPNVLPKHANTGQTTETFGEPIPGLWTIVSIERTYSGHVAFFSGSGKVDETMDHFQRFGDPDQAKQLLDSIRSTAR